MNLKSVIRRVREYEEYASVVSKQQEACDVFEREMKEALEKLETLRVVNKNKTKDKTYGKSEIQ